MFKILHEELSDKFNIFAGINDPAYVRDYRVVLEGYKKVRGGVKHLVKRYRKFDLKLCYQDITKYGYFSKRPYQLAQVCDGSIGNCVIALYYDFCQARQLSPSELLNLAYPEEKKNSMNFVAIKKIGDWEGVAYPQSWNKKSFEGLLESLTEINYHSLVSTLSEIVTITD